MNKEMSTEDMTKIELLPEPYKTIAKDGLTLYPNRFVNYEYVTNYLKQYVFTLIKDMCATFEPDSDELSPTEKFYAAVVQTIEINKFNIVDFNLVINDKDEDAQKIRINNNFLNISIPITLYSSGPHKSAAVSIE